MGRVALEDLKAGMILADDATSPNGRVLLRAGAEITDKHLKIFKSWGLLEAQVQGVSSEDIAAQAAAQIDPRQLERARQSMKGLFRHTNLKHPLMADLFRLCVLRQVTPAAKDD